VGVTTHLRNAKLQLLSLGAVHTARTRREDLVDFLMPRDEAVVQVVDARRGVDVAVAAGGETLKPLP
jgi:hypothetical protein